MEPVRSLEQGNGEAAEASGTEGLPAEAAAPTSLPGGVLSGITHLLVSEGPPDLVLAAVADALTEVVPHEDPKKTVTITEAPRDDAGEQLDSWHFPETGEAK